MNLGALLLLDVVERASMNHLVLVFLGLFQQDIVQTHTFLAHYAAAHVGVRLLVACLVDWDSTQLLAEDQVVLDVLVVGQVVQNQTEDLSELGLFIGVHETAYMLSLQLQLPLETRVFVSASLDDKYDGVHVEVDWEGEGVLLVLERKDVFVEVLSECNYAVHQLEVAGLLDDLEESALGLEGLHSFLETRAEA